MTDDNQNNSSQNSAFNQTGGPNQTVSYGMDKEKEMLKTKGESLQDVKEMEIPKEVEKHVVKTKETIELPPDLKKMGISTPPSTTSVSQMTTGTVKLPLSDDQIVQGLHMQILSSFRWLAEWCLKQLKKAHVHLKKMGEHFVRERD